MHLTGCKEMLGFVARWIAGRRGVCAAVQGSLVDVLSTEGRLAVYPADNLSSIQERDLHMQNFFRPDHCI